MKRFFSSVLALAAITLSGISRLPAAEEEPRGLVSFCVMGDVPYEKYEDVLLPLQIEALPRDIPFVVHVGDIKRGGKPCNEAVYAKVSGMLAKSRAPVFIIPGDNEYNDCPDPAAAWKLWDGHFNRFEERWQHDLPVSRQKEREENFAFVRNEVLFLGVHVLGGRVQGAEEWKHRHADDARWIRENLNAHGKVVEAVVVFGHATPTGKQADFFRELKKEAAAFGKPFVYIHGDSHAYVRYRPFAEVKNLEAIQVDRGGIAPPIRVTVSPAAEEAFQVDRRFEMHPEGFPRNELEAKARRERDGG